MTESYLSPKGRKYARIVFIVHNYCSKIKNKFLRKLASQFVLGTMASFVYIAILKEGAAEHARTSKAKMPRMPSGIGTSGERTTGQMREMRISNQGISTISPLVQTSNERNDTNTSSEKENY